MNTTIRDPKGNELKPILLQILERDDLGPTLLRARRDHETVDLTNEEHRAFLIVWGPVHSILGEMQLDDIAGKLHETKAELDKQSGVLVELKRRIDAFERDVEALQEENKTKTEALRQLQRERDPDRVARLVAETVETRTAALSQDLATARRTIEDQGRELDELRAAKKRLKEANERLKDKAK